MKKIINIVCVLLALQAGKIYSQCAGCPTVNAQFNTGPVVSICKGQSAVLTASVSQIMGANTNAYTVTSIPYAAQPNVGGAVGVTGVDDGWGGVQNSPFPICFYGQQFNQFVVGSNGALTFNPAVAGGYCPWPINTAWPSLANITTPNDIGVPYRDFTCYPAGSGGYWYVSGVMPNRTLVVYWKNMNLYSCSTPVTNTQLIYYEATSVIEIHIQSSTSCGSWNSGAGIVGIQNGTPVGVNPPGRNFPGAWSANNEAWRFSPSPAVPNWTWTAPGGSVISNGTMVTVTPTATGVYSAACIPGCTAGTVQVLVNTPPTFTPTSNSPLCQGTALNLLAGGGGTNTTYQWSGPGSYTANVQNPIIAAAQPSNSGIYTLIATNNFTAGPACSSTSTTPVSVIPVNQVTVTPQYTLCQNSTLNLQAINGVPPNGYGWTGPNAWTSTLSSPSIPNVNPTHNGNYCVTASYAVQGITLVCTSTACSNVSVVATSPVTLTLPQNLCEGATAVMSATANPMPLAFNWTGPNNFSAVGTSTSIVNVDPSHSGLYNVTGTWAIGTKSCYINNFAQLNVVDVNPIAINPPVSVCYPSNVQLTSNSPGAISYNWTSTTGFTSNLPNPLMGNPTPTATGIYTVTTAYTNGALICNNSNTTQVTVNPIIPFNLDPYKQLCFGQTYTLSGPAGATQYLWSGPASFTSSQQVLFIPSVQPFLAGTYSLEVILGPCKTYGTTKIDVLAPITWTHTPGNVTICRGDSVSLYAGASGGSHNYAYNWNPQQWLGSPTGSIQYGHPDGTTIYNITAYDIACPFYTIATSFTATVNKAPQPDLGLVKFEGCQPFCAHFNTKTGGSSTQVVYDFGNGNVMEGDDFDYCIQDAGAYSLKIRTTGLNGCTWNYEQPGPIIVNPLPKSDFTSDPDPVTTTNNNATFLPNNQQGNVTKYLWTFSGTKAGNNNNDTSSAKYPVRTYDKAGNYPVMLMTTTDKGCTDSVLKVIEVRDEFSIYIPNSFTPNGDNLNDVFNVKGVGMKSEGYSMEIYDRWGTLVYSTKDASKGWDGTVKGLTADNGTYVYKVKASGGNGEGKKEYVGHVTLLK
jgi:gliding motility-associated-like protein